jgi:phosphatidylinositol-3-phosphatase
VKKHLLSILVLLFPLLLKAQVPESAHVVLVMEENHSFSSVIGNSSMPYLNSLASQYALATQYYANTHPSIGNYLMLTTGQIITNDDEFSGTVDVDNIVRHMLSAGKTWKSYAESIPSVGYTGGDTGLYLRRHNPFSYLSDVVNSSVEKLNLVPFTQFTADLNNNRLPDFSYIAPNINDDAHNGTLQEADAWLKKNIAPLFNNPDFQKDGILIITFDESFDSDTAEGGGHIPAVIAGPLVKKAFQSATNYQHQNTLRTIMAALGMDSYPGAAAGAVPLEVFGGSSGGGSGSCSASGTGVTVCAPTPGETSGSPVHFVAAAKASLPITAMRIYVDGVSKYTTSASSLNYELSLSAGSHSVTVQAWDSAGAVFKNSMTIKVD